ncbi:MAG: hypothetical protein AUK47_15325 [Deltaproteobacteria bacterium CG2_30_63_29]|nr:MAG: hypothetical protein AUK47_15325 [Deltaproteobacteria bacterium CG2_30_63_29]PIW01532.1 MAG: hypothetical protein COW42_04610 [Deltaproteobacteria bacterium CG17_big_fil_post_rev_8_21_14_2_50_63_7]PJB40827.1 MAG: hypothetical protein CO108_14220 [Deltaproteobacteria bacterium CG_4_9_14_3_um_filter_63_12]
MNPIASRLTASMSRLLPLTLCLSSLAWSLAACTETLSGSFASDDIVHPSHDFYPDAPAEVLLYNRKVVMYAKDKAYVLDQVHKVMQLHTEGGLDYAEVRMNLWSNAEIVQFAARTINADGSVYLVGEDKSQGASRG